MSQRERAAYRATIVLAAFLAIAGHGRLHDGEAARARAKFRALTANEREALLSFLRSL